MVRCLSAVLTAVCLLAMTAFTQAQSEHNQKLLGTWTRHADGCKVKLEVKPQNLRCTVATEDGFAITVDADYVVSKDGILVGILHARPAKKKEKDKDDDGLSKRLFYFQITADEKALVIANLNFESSDDKMKEVLEGKYHKADDKHTAKADARAAVTPPSTPYLQHPPAYYAPKPKASPTQAQKTTDEPYHLTPERVHGGIEESSQNDWLRTWQFFTAGQLLAADFCSPSGWWVGW